jgi:outer membrane lipoprotein carrier protein
MNCWKKSCHFFLFFCLRLPNIRVAKGYFLSFVLLAQAAAIFLIVPWATGAGAAEAPPIDQLTAKMQETYDKTQDLTARFVQELTIASMKTTEREEGTVYFKKPGRMYWEYRKPKSDIIFKKLVVNPEKAWLYVPEDHVVYVQDAKAMYRSRLVIRLLSGMGSLGEDFRIEYATPEATDREGNYQLVLTPKQNDMGVDRLHLTVDQNTLQIVQCRFPDAYGNLTRLSFRNVKINNRLSESLFHFKPPPGVDILPVAP